MVAKSGELQRLGAGRANNRVFNGAVFYDGQQQ
jgi:hypothetical protein